MAAIFGLLPPPPRDDGGGGAPLNMTVVRNTADKMRDLWDREDCWGWDFPMLASAYNNPSITIPHSLLPFPSLQVYEKTAPFCIALTRIALPTHVNLRKIVNSLRLGDVDQAISYLLDPLFGFDDAGYPEGGSRVATPYFPGAGSLLLAVAMMAGGWDGDPGPHFPEDWDARVEGFIPGL